MLSLWKTMHGIFYGIIFSLLFSPFVQADIAKTHHTLTDMRGKKIAVPNKIERIVTIDDGLVEGVLTVLGQSHKIVGLASKCLRKTSSFSIPSTSGKAYVYNECMNPVFFLNPNFRHLPLVKDNSGGINLETLAGLGPDIVIFRAGACSALWGKSDTILEQNMNAIEALGIPVVVLYAPPYFSQPDLSRLPDEIRILGKLFKKENEAERIVAYLDKNINKIKERTRSVASGKKPTLLALGLSPKSRSGGGAGNVRGGIIKYYIEEIANAESTYSVERHLPDTGMISAEQLYAIDPDILILTTSDGYHPPEEIYDAPYYQNLAEMTAVKNRKVSALPFTPCNCDASRLEHVIDLMIIAKTAYPELFKDVMLHEWVLDFYQEVYNVDRGTAEKLRTAQLLDWTVKSNF